MTNNTQLQLAIAKMLPEKLELRVVYLCSFEDWHWKDEPSDILGRVKPTEWEHIIRLVEETLLNEERRQYIKTLVLNHPLKYNPFECNDPWMAIYFVAHATWQQRAQAILKVKGVV